MPHSRSSDLDLARDAARAAGAIVMAHFRRPEEVRFKAPEQPVTAADLAADRALRRILGSERPGYGWLSEETPDSTARLSSRRVWIVDPIDGTNSFIEGRAEFVISVGLAEQGRPVLGVVLNPATGELYHAVAGEGAFLGGERIRVAAPPAVGEPGTLRVSRSELARGEYAALEPGWRFVELGSTAYRMAKVAEGAAHLSLSRNVKSEWDVCAGALLVHEAGGRVTEIDGAALTFNQPVPRFRGIVASSGASHPVQG